MDPRNQHRSCQGCIRNAQRIAVLENRISYLEQNMSTGGYQSYHRGRSKSRRRGSKHRSKPRDKSKAKDDTSTDTSTADLSKDVSKLKITKLPDYVPKSKSVKSNLNPSADEFSPGPSGSQGNIGADGGASGYQ
ncbi:hypothetical protein [Linepithema humile rhabdo-like virus 1]|uniref:Uncharacterized protein n=1 Tax=Linepithema humile rhabdo-like virus 1 TaxID=2259786 RepID=A0AAD0PEE2_9MONO|nr:hypothetical protein QKQ05_gp5 [Linepithema humile rhabdo-like virus 1]AXA52567.1 hypothetical protein [Linepithema humile rhabdo-like virus 1]